VAVQASEMQTLTVEIRNACLGNIATEMQKVVRNEIQSAIAVSRISTQDLPAKRQDTSRVEMDISSLSTADEVDLDDFDDAVCSSEPDSNAGSSNLSVGSDNATANDPNGGSSLEENMESSNSTTVKSLSRTERWVNSFSKLPLPVLPETRRTIMPQFTRHLGCSEKRSRPSILRKHPEDGATPSGLNQPCISPSNTAKPVCMSRSPRSSRVRNAVSQWERMRSFPSVAECE